jgi:glycerol-3-phosphate dehydrogenase
VVLNARDAADRGAEVRTRTPVTGLRRDGDLWRIDADGEAFSARSVVNAAGPGVRDLLTLGGLQPDRALRLVRGSHIVVPKLFDHPFAYFFQLPDSRIFFAIPYEEDFTLIGTTDVDHAGGPIEASEAEIAYLCEGASRFFAQAVTPADVVWTYSGVRPLVDGGSGRPEAATRGYDLDLSDARDGAALMSIYGGKITTYRHLAQEAIERLAERLPYLRGGAWTGTAPLPGGDFPLGETVQLEHDFAARFPFLASSARRIVRAYGTAAFAIFAEARSLSECGRHFGHGLTERELDHLVSREWARTAEDVLWRRTKLGLRFSAQERQALEDHMTKELAR